VVQILRKQYGGCQHFAWHFGSEWNVLCPKWSLISASYPAIRHRHTWFSDLSSGFFLAMFHHCICSVVSITGIRKIPRYFKLRILTIIVITIIIIIIIAAEHCGNAGWRPMPYSAAGYGGSVCQTAGRKSVLLGNGRPLIALCCLLLMLFSTLLRVVTRCCSGFPVIGGIMSGVLLYPNTHSTLKT